MCFSSIKAAFELANVLDPSAKFVLLVICNCARNGLAWPSVGHICKITGYDERTVRAAVRRLIEAGYLTDTGERKGRNRSVKVFRLSLPTMSGAAETNTSIEQNDLASTFSPQGAQQGTPTVSTPAKWWGSRKTGSSACETPTKVSVNPITLTKTPEDAYASSSPQPFRRTSRKKTRRPLPEDWAPPSPTTLPPSTFSAVRDWSQDRWEAEADAFRDYCYSGAGKFSRTGNWNREWAQWVRQACSAKAAEGLRSERANPPTRSLCPVEERDREDSRELGFRRLLENCFGGAEWLSRSALKLAEVGYDESNPKFGLIIFARVIDRPAIEDRAASFRELAMQLGCNLQWHRIEVRH